VDRAVGTVLGALDARGMRDRTLVIVVGDHGEEFWEHGGVEHGHTVYEELIRVPLLMRWPKRLPEKAVSEALVRTVDIAPTVLDLLALPVGSTDGATLVPVLRGDEASQRVAVVENLLFAEERVGVRTIDREYVRWENGKEEVYDLARDPLELHDLAGRAAYARPLRQLYARVERDLSGASLVTAHPSVGPRRDAALRAFGYVQ
jgi:arylsulfatase A-like enzyme